MSNELENVITMSAVSKFVDTKPIVYRLNLQIPRGTLYGLLGPNGAGKSTAIKLLTGRIKANSGEIRVLGYDPWKDRVKVNTRIGYLPQNPIQYQEKTVGDFMVFSGRLKGLARNAAKHQGREILDQVGMGRFEDSKIGKLSGGEKQRLGFANALLADPEILILDEPTASLDPAGRVYVMNLIQELARDRSKTVIISSHILPEIRRMTNHVAIMADGSVLTSGNINQLTRDIYDNEYEIRSNRPEDLLKVLQGAGYYAFQEKDRIFVSSNGRLEDLWDDIPKLSQSANIQIRAFVPVRDSLEKLFLQLVSRRHMEDENEGENQDE